MPIKAGIEQSQSIQVSVNGPGDIASMFITCGLLLVPFDLQQPTGDGSQSVSFSTMLPQPLIAIGKFRRAIASASLAGISSSAAAGNTSLVGNAFNVTIDNVDADYYDESGQIELRVDVFFGAHMGEIRVTKLSFQVIILLAT